MKFDNESRDAPRVLEVHASNAIPVDAEAVDTNDLRWRRDLHFAVKTRLAPLFVAALLVLGTAISAAAAAVSGQAVVGAGHAPSTPNLNGAASKLPTKAQAGSGQLRLYPNDSVCSLWAPLNEDWSCNVMPKYAIARDPNDGSSWVSLYDVAVSNISTTQTSGTIRVRLVASAQDAPLSAGSTYLTLGEFALDPLPPSVAWRFQDRTVSYSVPPDGIHQVFLIVEEYDPAACPPADGYCTRDSFPISADALQGIGTTKFVGGFPPKVERPTRALAVEYYNSTLGHYFTTTGLAEISALDGDRFPGWTRTGSSYYVNRYPYGGALPVCRFFSAAFAPKSSHFYTSMPAECEHLKANPAWQYEGDIGFIVPPYLAGECLYPDYRPLYRLYNDGMGGAPNHRFTTQPWVLAEMQDKGWVSEGYGPLGVIGCVDPSPWDRPAQGG